MNEDNDVDNKLRYHTMIDADGDDDKDGDGDDSDKRLRYQTLMDDDEEVGDDVDVDDKDGMGIVRLFIHEGSLWWAGGVSRNK